MINATNLTENEIALEKELLWDWKLNAPFVKELIEKFTLKAGTSMNYVYDPEGNLVFRSESWTEAFLWIEKTAVNSFVWED